MKTPRKEFRSLVSVRINEVFYVKLMRHLRSRGHSFAGFVQRAAEVYMEDAVSGRTCRIDNIPVMPHSKKRYTSRSKISYVV